MSETTPEPDAERTWSLEGVLGTTWANEEHAVLKVDPMYGLVQALFATLEHHTKALAAVSQALAEQQARNAELVAAGRKTSGTTPPAPRREAAIDAAAAWSDFRKSYGVSLRGDIRTLEHRSFVAGYEAGTGKDLLQGGTE
jgi:hypothetical protein